jgi:hypothetical protein
LSVDALVTGSHLSGLASLELPASKWSTLEAAGARCGSTLKVATQGREAAMVRVQEVVALGHHVRVSITGLPKGVSGYVQLDM